jgi:HK97 family phage prohead protease
MYAAWGGDEMHRWAERTLNNMKEEKSERHIKKVEETATEIIITYGKSEPMEEAGYKEDEEDKRAEADEVNVGDFVSWNSSGGRSQGVIVEVERNGQIESDSGFKVNGTAEDPAALISIYEYDSEEQAFTERKPPLRVAHLFSTLTKVDGAEVRSKENLVEQRSYNSETRAVEGRTVEGYASVFNSMSEDLGGFREIILPGAFKNALNDDIRALYNHDSNYLLARTASGTLEVKEDDKGLYYRFEMPNTSYGNDLLELYKRGDLTQSSFGFTVDKDSWRLEDGQHVRYIESVSSLFDVSAVVFPAYASASSGLRSAEPNGEGEAEEAREKNQEKVDYSIYENLIKLAKDEC